MIACSGDSISRRRYSNPRDDTKTPVLSVDIRVHYTIFWQKGKTYFAFPEKYFLQTVRETSNRTAALLPKNDGGLLE
jgi:hypothetical protein